MDRETKKRDQKTFDIKSYWAQSCDYFVVTLFPAYFNDIAESTLIFDLAMKETHNVI